ncbi:BZ3500_MvSof-1268-A1-R1_Chr1-1g01028 [Microbotryum saponariae]|uniref:BZ3500_MvSof-1268-A1-R1_Chr1-1g01028 protein n=1 Tax=Microbotryum saponariae TaxID=289078 RepID=A0A2X0KEV5_9BASI|nr:BZ3500_MvSof-1268-A1-R1_Chr1-1g01028 [Microbotryum saponariae]SCZ93222.1 BZ3501_MvSof-1269-A2-R1_Chr1-1g00625 [Microbotryum saponariae]
MPRRLDYVYGDKPEISSPTTARAVESVSSISTAAQSPEIGGLGRTIASPSTSSGARPTAPYRAQLPERDYDDYTPSISPANVSLLHERLQILTASQRLAITFHPPRGSSERDDSGDPLSISPRPSASPPATTSQAASLRLQELARSLQVQAATERERVAEQLRTSTATSVGWVGTTSFSTGPAGSPLVMRERYSRGRNTGVTVDHAPEEDESGSSQDEDDEEEDHGLDGDVITFADRTVPSEEVLQMWYDTRRLEMGQVDANGVKQTKRTSHCGTLEGR